MPDAFALIMFVLLADVPQIEMMGPAVVRRSYDQIAAISRLARAQPLVFVANRDAYSRLERHAQVLIVEKAPFEIE